MNADITFSTVRACVDVYWAVKAGATTPAGLLVAFAFSMASVAAGFVALRGRREADKYIWASMSALLACAAANTQLDLLSGFTEIGRCLARLQGWYGMRQSLQANLMIGLWVALGLSALVFWRLRRGLKSALPALAGVALILALTAARAVSEHHMDAFIRRPTLGMPLGAWVALLAAGAITANALWLLALISGRLRRNRPQRQPAPRQAGA